jgi:hypothetical protein
MRRATLIFVILAVLVGGILMAHELFSAIAGIMLMR